MTITIRCPSPGWVKRALVNAIPCGALLALPACHIPHVRQPEQFAVLPPSYDGEPNGANGATIQGTSESANSGLLRVDEYYNDPVLTHLVCQALVGNRELKILEEEIQIASNEIQARRGAIFPVMGVGASGGWDRNSRFTPLGAAEEQLQYQPGRFFPKTPGSYFAGLTFGMPLDIWRELRNARDAAGQRYLAAQEQRQAFVTRIVAEIAERYYTLMALDKTLDVLDETIKLQEQSLQIAKARFAAGRGTELAVQRFLAEVRRNQSERLLVRQQIVESENRINFLLGRLPQPIERDPTKFLELTIPGLSVGIPAQLLKNRPDIRQAEHELAAAGLEIQVARARFFPRVALTGRVGYGAFNPRYLFDMDALVFNAAGEMVAPLINKAAIRADYSTANAQQLQTVYNYQQVVLDAFTEVINQLSKVQNFSKSIELKKKQLLALEESVQVASNLFQNARVEYIEVLFAQRDLLEARTVLIDTKREQIAAMVRTYQALGGGSLVACHPPVAPLDGVKTLPASEPAPEAVPLPAPREVESLPEPPPPPVARPEASKRE